MSTSAPPPLVSVVMIFRDAARFIEESIASVIAQTHPAELLLCDDGSTDESTEIAQRWASRLPERVRYLHHDDHAHRGMSATRNLGVREARGDLIAFLDADDVWEPGHLAHDVALLLRHPHVGMVCGRALLWYSWAQDGQRDLWIPPAWPAGSVVPGLRMLAATLRRNAYTTPTCNLLVRRTLLEDVSGSEESFTSMFEDQALLAKLYLRSSAVISGSTTARYRQHEESASARAKRLRTYAYGVPNASTERYLRWLDDHLSARTGGDGELVAALESALVPYRSGNREWRSVARRRLRGALPPQVLRFARSAVKRARAARGRRVRMGSLRRLTPVSRHFGFDRGLPIDRYYIEQFLHENALVIAGRVLEVGDSEYTRRFGGSRVVQADVLNVRAGHPETTFVGDLADGAGLPNEAFDCVVLTQTLHLVYDLPAAVRTLHRILRPGGTLLATFPGISPLSDDEWAATWHWSLTPVSAARLFGDVFGTENVEVDFRGNVLSSIAFLHGLAAHELRPGELAWPDPQFPMLITLRAGRSVAPRT
ncbi:glycosyltransferase [Modestobacter sp. URMC 112]